MGDTVILITVRCAQKAALKVGHCHSYYCPMCAKGCTPSRTLSLLLLSDVRKRLHSKWDTVIRIPVQCAQKAALQVGHCHSYYCPMCTKGCTPSGTLSFLLLSNVCKRLRSKWDTVILITVQCAQKAALQVGHYQNIFPVL